MSTSPTVSVVIPAYNHERYVAGAIGSVLGQTFADFELIVVDDASSDATWGIVADFSDPRVRAFRHAVNLGAHATLNEGVDAARGRFIAVLNSDDVFAPRRLEVLVATARQATEAEVFAFTDIEFIDAGGMATPAHPRAAAHARLTERCQPDSPDLWFLTGNPAIGTSNYFFSKSLFDATGPFAPLRYTHDWDWALRATRRCTPIWIHEKLLSYRIHDANTLAEDDVWRHVHENSLVQAEALVRLRDRPAGVAAGSTPREVCMALLRNESLHPVSLLYLLALHLAGAGEAEIRELSTPQNGVWPLSSIAIAAGYPNDLFFSARHLVEMKDALASQATLIEQRWAAIQHMSDEIANRDQWIANLQTEAALLRDSITHRDRQITSLQSQLEERAHELEDASKALDTVSRRLDALHASRLVRAALYLGRMLRRIGMKQADPRLR